MSMVTYRQAQPFINVPPGLQILYPQTPKEKVVVVMGATGTGKSKLSIDLATRFPAEIINSDKIQVYKGLDIVTNKINEKEQRGIPHHLLGVENPNSNFTVTDFCREVPHTLASISGRGQLPIIVGGSNSYIEALIDDENYEFQLKYDCCFLWVDVSMSLLQSFVSARVDRMVESGMLDEVRNMFDPYANYSYGIRRAIGVPEFDEYFRLEAFLDDEARRRCLQEAINNVKKNTFKLACRQLEKIQRLRNVKRWKLHRLDATDVFRKHGKEADMAWDKLVANPSSMIVNHFLYNFGPQKYSNSTSFRSAPTTAMKMLAAL